MRKVLHKLKLLKWKHAQSSLCIESSVKREAASHENSIRSSVGLLQDSSGGHLRTPPGLLRDSSRTSPGLLRTPPGASAIYKITSETTQVFFMTETFL